MVWAVAAGLDPGRRPRSGQLDLLGGADHTADGDDPAQPWAPVRPDGYLRPGWAELRGRRTAPAAAGWAACALRAAEAHRAALADRPGRRS